ncbi:MAG: hypothetical protein HC781_13915 [Leptolyngbyaceae cyanobacterium CSU_1_4]|nr:hypothetical protein [Leptolyngbyaceae cyanobacterium CSU_1_4]
MTRDRVKLPRRVEGQSRWVASQWIASLESISLALPPYTELDPLEWENYFSFSLSLCQFLRRSQFLQC